MSSDLQAIFTIGHSTRPIDEFLALLDASNIQRVVDVRRLPGSRAFPQFDADALRESLAQCGIDYWHLASLCGRRSAGEVRGLPTDEFWTNASFARYAAWARGDVFRQGLDELIAWASTERCVLMCSEAVWWRCHRRIIADHLLARGHHVRHIMGLGKVVEATLTRGAKVENGTVIYQAGAAACALRAAPINGQRRAS